MNPEITRQQEDITISLGSKDQDVNAEAVASMIRAITTIVAETQRELKSNEQILVKARPFAKGSFEIPLDLVFVGMPGLFESTLLQQVLDTIRSYIAIRTELKGAKLPEPDDAGAVVINGQNVIISESTIQVLNSQRVSDAFDRAASDVAADPSIDNVKIFRGKERETLATISSKQLSYFQIPELIALESTADRDRRVKAELVLRSPVFQGKGKWKFNFDGSPIGATISDEAFLQRVNTGIEKFASGDRLMVELVIRERFNDLIRDYERTGNYVVERVLDHSQQQPDQGSDKKDKNRRLFEDTDDQ